MSERVSVADAARAALAAQTGGSAVVIAALIDGAGGVLRMLISDDGVHGTLGDVALDERARGHAAGLLTATHGEPHIETLANGRLLYMEVHRPHERVIVVGAGHIAVPVAALARTLGFQVTVLDDREEFATSDRFADDVSVLRADFEHDPFADVTIDEHTYIALLTRGHRWDFDCLRRVLHAPVQPRYIGMIGSRRRVRAAFQALLEAGTPRAALARIHAPIGIEIRAETPAEIAVAIAAELIAVRRGADPETISRRERVLDRFLPETAEENETDA